MKIIGFNDVITNSSSEVFCTIKSDDEEVLRKIKETLGDLGESDWGEGGTYLDMEEKTITVDLPYGVRNCIDILFRPGMEKLLEPWEGKYSIEYDN